MIKPIMFTALVFGLNSAAIAEPSENLIKSGISAPHANAIATEINSLKSEISKLRNFLNNGVVAFKLDRCPRGWSDYAPAYGRFIRGIDNSSSGTDPAGRRNPGDLQSDAFGFHSHKQIFESLNVGRKAGDRYIPFVDRGAAKGKETTAAGDSETRPKNVALLYCIRN